MKAKAIVLVLCLTGCSSLDSRLDPQLELGLGASVHDNESWTNGDTAIGYVGADIAPIKRWSWFRTGVKHISDPTTFDDAGTTWLQGSVRFGAN